MNNSLLEDRISNLINSVLNNNIGRNINFISIEVIPVHTSYEASPQVNNLSNLQPYKLIRPEDDIIVNNEEVCSIGKPIAIISDKIENDEAINSFINKD